MERKYFGTDGIRGRVGEAPITPDFFLKLGWAVGRVLASSPGSSPGRVLIGKDTRISGYMFEAALEAGLISAGVDVGLLGPMPTPAIAYLTRTYKAAAGIVISASHNPYTDNGIKLFSTDGTKLSDELEMAIEAQLDLPMQIAERLGKAERLADVRGRYIEFCKGTLPWGFNLKGLHIVLDCANGATFRVAPAVFEELGATIKTIAKDPDGVNINLNCGSTKVKFLQQQVLEAGADLGIAFDGDGDRVMFVDSTGDVIDGDQLLFIIAAYQHKHGGGCPGVVGTLMSNFGFEVALSQLGVPLLRANVGDRYVIEGMKEKGWSLGGENSGHLVCSD
ncbi:MAG: phosphoglucosamine mutase, partial [Sphingobacteriales bacterium]